MFPRWLNSTLVKNTNFTQHFPARLWPKMKSTAWWVKERNSTINTIGISFLPLSLKATNTWFFSSYTWNFKKKTYFLRALFWDIQVREWSKKIRNWAKIPHTLKLNRRTIKKKEVNFNAKSDLVLFHSRLKYTLSLKYYIFPIWPQI